MSRLFQINEDDLAELERTLPAILNQSYALLTKDNPGANRLRVQFRRVRDILCDVRWNYGPPGVVEKLPFDEPDSEAAGPVTQQP